MKFNNPKNTFIQPAIVYILKGSPKILNPASPNGVTAACKPGPTTNPNT